MCQLVYSLGLESIHSTSDGCGSRTNQDSFWFKHRIGLFLKNCALFNHQINKYFLLLSFIALNKVIKFLFHLRTITFLEGRSGNCGNVIVMMFNYTFVKVTASSYSFHFISLQKKYTIKWYFVISNNNRKKYFKGGFFYVQ